MSNENTTPNQRLKKVRFHLRYNQKQIASEIGVKPSFWCDVENCRRPVSQKFVIGLCTRFNISADWLLTGNGNMLQTGQNGAVMPAEVVEAGNGAETTRIEVIVGKTGISVQRYGMTDAEAVAYLQLAQGFMQQRGQ